MYNVTTRLCTRFFFFYRSRAKLHKHAGRVQIGLAKVRLVAEAKSIVQPGRSYQENR